MTDNLNKILKARLSVEEIDTIKLQMNGLAMSEEVRRVYKKLDIVKRRAELEDVFQMYLKLNHKDREFIKTFVGERLRRKTKEEK